MIDEYNQTQFAQEEPLYESPLVMPVEESAIHEPKKKNPLKWVIIGVGGFLGLIVMAVVMIKIFSPSSTQVPTTDTTETEIIPQVLTGFEQRLTELSQELEVADPTKDTLPFPPVKMDL